MFIIRSQLNRLSKADWNGNSTLEVDDCLAILRMMEKFLMRYTKDNVVCVTPVHLKNKIET